MLDLLLIQSTIWDLQQNNDNGKNACQIEEDKSGDEFSRLKSRLSSNVEAVSSSSPEGLRHGTTCNTQQYLIKQTTLMLIEELEAGGIRPDKSAIVCERAYILCPFYIPHYFNFAFDLPSFIGCIVSVPKLFLFGISLPHILRYSFQRHRKSTFFAISPAAFSPVLCTQTIPHKLWQLDDLSNFLSKVLKSLTQHTKQSYRCEGISLTIAKACNRQCILKNVSY